MVLPRGTRGRELKVPETIDCPLGATCVFDGPINGQRFPAYVEQQLVPVLKPAESSSWTKSAAIRRAIKAAGAKLWFMPPYSPNLTPIVQAFSKIKHWMRQAQRRTIDDTWRHIGRLVETNQPHECANYLTNAGYLRQNIKRFSGMSARAC